MCSKISKVMQFRISTLLLSVVVIGALLAWVTTLKTDPVIVGDWRLPSDHRSSARMLAERNGQLSIKTVALDLEVELYGTWKQLDHGKYELLIEKQFSNAYGKPTVVVCNRRLLLRCGLCDNGCLILDNLVGGDFVFGNSSNGEMLPYRLVIPSDYWVRLETSPVEAKIRFQNKKKVPVGSKKSSGSLGTTTKLN